MNTIPMIVLCAVIIPCFVGFVVTVAAYFGNQRAK